MSLNSKKFNLETQIYVQERNKSFPSTHENGWNVLRPHFTTFKRRHNCLILRLTCSPAIRLDIEAAIVPPPANCCCIRGFRRVLLCFVKFLQTWDVDHDVKSQQPLPKIRQITSFGPMTRSNCYLVLQWAKKHRLKEMKNIVWETFDANFHASRKL